MDVDVADTSFLIGGAATLLIAAFIGVIMKLSFSSQEEAYSQHITTLYGRNSGKSVKSGKSSIKRKKAARISKVLDETDSNDTYNEKQDKPVKPDDELSDHHHVEYDPDPVVIDEQITSEIKPTVNKHKAKKKKSKSILHNKDERALVRSEEITPREEFKPNVIPKDDIELLHNRADNSKVGHAPPSPPEVVEEEMIKANLSSSLQSHAVIAPVNGVADDQVNNSLYQTENLHLELSTTNQELPSSANGTPRKSGRKSKSKHQGERRGAASDTQQQQSKVDRLLHMVHQLSLSHDEMQLLVDVLVGEHKAESWETKGSKGDKLDQLNKILSETQQALENERNALYLSNSKLNELKSKNTVLERNYGAANTQAHELQRRLSQVNQQHAAELQVRYQEGQRMQQHLQQITEENQNLRKALPNPDESSHLKQQLRAMQGNYENQQRHLLNSDKRCQDLTVQLATAEESYRKCEMSRTELSVKVNDLSQAISRLERQAGESQTRAHAAENDLRNLQDHLKDKDLEIKELHSEILSAKQATTDSMSVSSKADNSRIMQLESQAVELQMMLRNKEKEIDDASSQLREARSELEALRHTAVPHTNGDSNNSETDKKLIYDLEDKVMQLQADLDITRSKNDELRKKNYTMVDSLNQAEMMAGSVPMLEREIDKKTSDIHDLKDANHSLKEQNMELIEKVEQLQTSAGNYENLKQEANDVKRIVDERDKMIRRLELQLQEEKEKVHATEAECRNLIENELMKSIKSLEEDHLSRIHDLERQLDLSDSRIADLEAMLLQSDSKSSLEGDTALSQACQEIKSIQLLRQLSESQNEVNNLQSKLTTLEIALRTENDASTSLKLVPVLRYEVTQKILKTQNSLVVDLSKSMDGLHERTTHVVESQNFTDNQIRSMLSGIDPAISLPHGESIDQSLHTFYNQAVAMARKDEDNHYKRALQEAEKMLDKLSVTWQKEMKVKDDTINELTSQLSRFPQSSSNKDFSTSFDDNWEFISYSEIPSTQRALSDSNIAYDVNCTEILNDLDKTRRMLTVERGYSRQLSHQLVVELSRSGSFEDFGSTV